LHYTPVLFQYRLYRAGHAYFNYLMLQRQLSHLNGRKLHHRQVEAYYIFYVWFQPVVYPEYIYSHDFVILLLVAFTILFYNYIHTEG
jgi:hypothetical protein